MNYELSSKIFFAVLGQTSQDWQNQRFENVPHETYADVQQTWQ